MACFQVQLFTQLLAHPIQAVAVVVVELTPPTLVNMDKVVALAS
jgi:hypothetical protein